MDPNVPNIDQSGCGRDVSNQMGREFRSAHPTLPSRSFLELENVIGRVRHPKATSLKHVSRQCVPLL